MKLFKFQSDLFKRYAEKGNKTFELEGIYYSREEAEQRAKNLKSRSQISNYMIKKRTKEDMVMGEQKVYGLYIY